LIGGFFLSSFLNIHLEKKNTTTAVIIHAIKVVIKVDIIHLHECFNYIIVETVCKTKDESNIRFILVYFIMNDKFQQHYLL
jgi:hypothetical protein